jgi:hypothetical protein
MYESREGRVTPPPPPPPFSQLKNVMTTFGPVFFSHLIHFPYLIGGPADLIMAIIEMATEGAEEPLLATQAAVRDPGLVPRDLSRLLVLRHPQVLGRRGGRRGDIAVREIIAEEVVGVGPFSVKLHQEWG